MAMMEGMPANQMMGAQGGKESGGNPIENVDVMLGAFSKSLAEKPQGADLAKRLEAIRAEYRDVMMQAINVMQGGGSETGARGQQPMPTMQSTHMADRSMGMPHNPAGAY